MKMMYSSYNAVWDDDEPRTLCDWVKNFRIKKIQMKRKLRAGGDLRICAILSTALLSAEHELRRKQQERFSRWLEMQSKFDKPETITRSCAAESNMMSSAAATINCCNIDETSNMALTQTTTTTAYDRRDEISNIWKSELNSLDEFMRNIGNKSKSAIKNEIFNIQNGDHHHHHNHQHHHHQHEREQYNCSGVVATTSTNTPSSIEVAS